MIYEAVFIIGRDNELKTIVIRVAATDKRAVIDSPMFRDTLADCLTKYPGAMLSIACHVLLQK